MIEMELWEKAREKAIKDYEEETGDCWEDADKYEREDWMWSAYLEFKHKK